MREATDTFVPETILSEDDASDSDIESTRAEKPPGIKKKIDLSDSDDNDDEIPPLDQFEKQSSEKSIAKEKPVVADSDDEDIPDLYLPPPEERNNITELDETPEIALKQNDRTKIRQETERILRSNNSEKTPKVPFQRMTLSDLKNKISSLQSEKPSLNAISQQSCSSTGMTRMQRLLAQQHPTILSEKPKLSNASQFTFHSESAKQLFEKFKKQASLKNKSEVDSASAASSGKVAKEELLRKMSEKRMEARKRREELYALENEDFAVELRARKARENGEKSEEDEDYEPDDEDEESDSSSEDEEEENNGDRSGEGIPETAKAEENNEDDDDDMAVFNDSDFVSRFDIQAASMAAEAESKDSDTIDPILDSQGFVKTQAVAHVVKENETISDIFGKPALSTQKQMEAMALMCSGQFADDAAEEEGDEGSGNEDEKDIADDHADANSFIDDEDVSDCDERQARILQEEFDFMPASSKRKKKARSESSSLSSESDDDDESEWQLGGVRAKRREKKKSEGEKGAFLEEEAELSSADEGKVSDDEESNDGDDDYEEDKIDEKLPSMRKQKKQV